MHRPQKDKYQDLMDCSLPEETPCSSLKRGKETTIQTKNSTLMSHTHIICQLTHAPTHTHTPTLARTHTHSAKTKDGVQQAFEELVHKVLQTPSLYTTDSPSGSFNVTPQEGGATDEGWGCSC